MRLEDKCPFCEENHLTVIEESAHDVPNGNGALRVPKGYFIRCEDLDCGPDLTGSWRTAEEAIHDAAVNLKEVFNK